MLTDTQVQVLGAVNDHCEVHGQLVLDLAQPMPDLLADLGLPTDELLTAVADLHELGLIVGMTTAEFAYPTHISGLTAKGRQELP